MRSGRFAHRVAVITGGASGIGLATARRLVAEGAHVALGDINREALSAAVAELGSAAAGSVCDVRDDASVATLFDTAIERFGTVDIAFANAGIGGLSPIVATDPVEWMRVIEINQLGVILTVKHAARTMTGPGSIVLTASLNAVQPATGMSAYCASKAAVAMIAKVAAMELGPRQIRVNAIGPGLVRTPLTDGVWMLPELVDDYVGRAPMKIHATAEQIAGVVAFLASDDAAAISGVLHLVDGGAHTTQYPDMMGHFGLH